MTILTLRSDAGPDLKVSSENRIAHVAIVCGKSGKEVGHCSMYTSKKSMAIYFHDRRRKVGDNRGYYILPRMVSLAEVLAMTGPGYEYKELLRRAGFDGPEVTLNLDDAVCMPKEPV